MAHADQNLNKGPRFYYSDRPSTNGSYPYLSNDDDHGAVRLLQRHQDFTDRLLPAQGSSHGSSSSTPQPPPVPKTSYTTTDHVIPNRHPAKNLSRVPVDANPRGGIYHNPPVPPSNLNHLHRLERRKKSLESMKKNFLTSRVSLAAPLRFEPTLSPHDHMADGDGGHSSLSTTLDIPYKEGLTALTYPRLLGTDPSSHHGNCPMLGAANFRLPQATTHNARIRRSARVIDHPDLKAQSLLPTTMTSVCYGPQLIPLTYNPNRNNNNSNEPEDSGGEIITLNATAREDPRIPEITEIPLMSNHSPATNFVGNGSLSTVTTTAADAPSTHADPSPPPLSSTEAGHVITAQTPLIDTTYLVTASQLTNIGRPAVTIYPRSIIPTPTTNDIIVPERKRFSDKNDVAFALLSTDGSQAPKKYYGSKGRKGSTLFWCILASLFLLAVAAIAALTYALVLRSKYFRVVEKINEAEKTCYTPECISIAAMLLEGIDKMADPCDDFYQFACGTWNKLHIIPEDRSSISTFEVLSSKLQIVLKSLLEEDEDARDMVSINKAKALYKSCANNTYSEVIGDEPLMETLQDLGGWPILNKSWNSDNFSMEIMMARLFMYNTPAFLEILVGPDDKNSSINILQMDQNSLVLPSREYYLNPNNNIILRAYKRLVHTIALLMGASGPHVKAEAEEIVNLEVDIALASVPSADRHDASAIYQKLSFRRLSKIVPQFNWMKFIHHIPNDFLINDTEQLVIYSEPFLKMLGQIIKVTPPRKLANYALWRHVNAFLPHLPQRYADALFAFRKIIYGVSAPVIKWQQCVEYVADHMGMPVGAMFVREHFRNGSKETALEMIHDIRDAFNELLHANQWMDNETRKVAEEKANAMNELIGYPESIFDENELDKEYEEINTTSNFLTNVISIGIHEFTKNFAELRKPVNKDGWGTGPAVVNAFYSPNKNNIVIPAGILQPLFYSETFPKSLNYGGIGVVIGHEITHGFDEKGRQFDKEGNLKQWWNNSTIKAFRSRAQCIIDQYSSYKLKEIDMNINGRNTQGENIADNGGLKQAFRAYQKWVHKHGPEKLLPGINLTHNQLFFLNYAQIWCGSMRPEEAVNKIHSSVHSPGPIRILGPLSNSHDFANAYNCRKGSKMNPVQKCSVW